VFWPVLADLFEFDGHALLSLSRITDFLHCYLRYTADATKRGWGKRDAGAGRFDYARAETFQPLVSALVCGRTHVCQRMLLNSRFFVESIEIAGEPDAEMRKGGLRLEHA